LSLFVFSIKSTIAEDLNDTLQKLRSRSPAIRIDAALALGETRDQRAVSSLVAVLKKDKDGDVRGAAEDALVNIGTPAVNSLIPIFDEGGDEELDHSSLSFFHLCRHHHPGARGVLLSSASDVKRLG
jgi:HEAT repeat protein